MLQRVARTNDVIPVLAPGRNIWRTAQAERARVLIDGAEYFGVLRRSLLAARRSVLIAGWDIDSRTPLVGEREPEDGLPRELGAFLSALVAARPELTVKLLLWDYSVLYALEREFMPVVALQWSTPKQIELCLDDAVPVGSSHHQKIVVVDDRVGFCGGLDLTIRRWDDGRHAPENATRVDPAGAPYPPFHDVQMMVEGEAAAALGAIFRERWLRAASEDLDDAESLAGAGDPDARVEAAAGALGVPTRAEAGGEGVAEAAAASAWPEDVASEFLDIAVGIARTQPEHGSIAEIRENERLFLDMVAAAERWIYIENQFLTCLPVAEAIAVRMRERPNLEVVLVGPKTHHTWIEHQAMLGGRIRFFGALRDQAGADRALLLHPEVGPEGSAQEVMVHSKVMIVDDRLLRVGSSNLANRSMGTDTECDLAVEAVEEDDRSAVAQVLHRFLAEHCGAPRAAVARTLAETGSLIATIRAHNSAGRRLAEIDDGPLPEGEIGRQVEAIADPERPPVITDVLIDHSSDPPRPARASALWKGLIALAVVAAVAVAWQFAPADILDQRWIARWLPEPGRVTSPFVIVGIFVAAGLIAFPVTILIAATAAIFGPWPGALYATAGAVASALVGYVIGRLIGRGTIRGSLGPRVNRIGESISDKGILAVTAVRLVPVAPFSVVNIVAGAMHIPLVDFVAGTALGLAPGVLVLSFLGDRVIEAIRDPSAGEIAAALAAVGGWLALSIGLQWSVSRWRRARRQSDG